MPPEHHTPPEEEFGRGSDPGDVSEGGMPDAETPVTAAIEAVQPMSVSDDESSEFLDVRVPPVEPVYEAPPELEPEPEPEYEPPVSEPIPTDFDEGHIPPGEQDFEG